MPDDELPSLQSTVAALLQTQNWVQARDAAIKLGTSGDRRAVPDLCRALIQPEWAATDSYWAVREEAARALARLGDPRAVEPLCVMLKDRASIAAVAAAEALGVFQDARAVEPLCEALHSHTVHLPEAAARALGSIGDRRAVEPLIAVLKGTLHSHSFAIIALGTLGDRRAVQPLCGLLYTACEDDRRLAAYALGKLRYDDALTALHERLRFFGGERRRNVRRAIHEAIAAIHDIRR
jgi:HEAT repeat protein